MLLLVKRNYIFTKNKVTMKQYRKLVLIPLFILMLFILINTSLVLNLWHLLIEPAYIIPAESSVFMFKPTVMNSGSGDWWIYGKDKNNYYYFTGSDRSPYDIISKDNIKECPSFDPKDHGTWCNKNP